MNLSVKKQLGKREDLDNEALKLHEKNKLLDQ